ncbi:hypothetical protein GOV06_03890 [Candidatus Woesearchaeota archaeon]|nr:hypothetical protein [Candidatus Woesearchaeota archaeon]
MAGRTYLIVREEDSKLHVKRIVDMTAVLDDLSSDADDIASRSRLLEAVQSEYQKLREQYPASSHEIQETYADEFPPLSPEGQYLEQNKPREVLASNVLNKAETPK